MPSGPKKRRAARRNRNRKGETGDSQFEEDDYFEPTSIKEEGLAVKTANPDVELAKTDDDLSSKGVVLVPNVGSKDLESVSEGKEVKEHVLDSSLEENNEKMPLPGDVVSSREIILEQDVGFKDVLELGSTENDGKEVAKDVLDLSIEEDDDGKQPHAEVLDSGPVLRGSKKRRAARRNKNKKGETADSQFEEDDLIEPTTTRVGDGLAVKTADPDVELAKAVDDISSKGVTVLVQNVGSKDGLESVSEGKEVKEVKEHANDSSLEENNDKPVDANISIESTSVEVADKLAVERTAAAADVDEKMSLPADVVSSKEFIPEQDVDFKDVSELGSTKIDGKEGEEDVLDSIEEDDDDDDGKQPQAEVLDSGPVLRGPKRRTAARRNKNKKGETTDSQFEEDDLIEPTTTEVEDGLAVKTADPDVKLAKAVDALSPKGVVVINVGSNDGLECVSKEKEMKEHILDTSLEENHDKPVYENVIVESTSIEVADRLAGETTAAADEKISLPGDVVSSREITLDQDVDFKDALELGSTGNDGKEVAEDVLDSSLEEDDDEGKQPQAEVLVSGPVLKGRKKRRATKKKSYVSSHNDTDSQVEENALIKHTSVKVEDSLEVKTATADVESGEPVDSLSIKRVILVQDVVPKDVFESGLRGNDGKEVSEDVLESRLEKDESKEPPADINDSGPKENKEKRVEVSLVEASHTKLKDGMSMTTAADVEWADAVDILSEGDVEVVDVGSEHEFEVGLKGNDGKEVIQDVRDLNLEDDEGKESPPTEVNDSGPKENDDNLVEENVLIEANSTMLEDGLAVTTADVNTDKPIDEAPSTKEISLFQDVGSQDAFQLDLNKNEGNDVIEDILDSSLERVEGKEPHVEVNESSENENPEKPVDKNAIFESSSIEKADRVPMEDIAADDLEVAETVNVLSSIGMVLVQGLDFEEALDLGLNEHDQKEGAEDVLDSSLKEDDGKQSLDVLDSSPALKGRKKKRRAAKKKTSVSSQNENGSQDEENAFTEPTSIKVEDGLVVKTVVAADVELGEPVLLSTKEVILVQDAGHEDVFDLGLRSNEDVLDSSLNKDESLNNDELKEPPVEVNGSNPKENEEKPVDEISLVKPYTKLEDSLAMITAVDVGLPESVDTVSVGVVVAHDVGSRDGFEVGLKGNDRKEVIHEALDLSMEEAKGKERPTKPNDSGLKENDDNLVEENVLIEANSTDLEDSLAVTTAAVDVVLAKPVDEASSKGVVLVQDSDSSLEKVEGKEQSMEANDSGAKENHEKTIEGDSHSDPTSIQLKDGLSVTTAADVELAELVDPISTKGDIFVRDLDSENILELGSKENEGKDVNNNVIDSSSEEDDGKETPADYLGPGSVLKGRRKRRATKRKTNVSSHYDSDSQVKENASIKPTSIKVEDGLVSKTVADDVELGEPVDALSTKGVILLEAGPEDVFQLGLRANDGKEVYEDVLEPRLEKDEWKEPPVEINESGPKENEEKLVMEVSLNEASYTKSEDGLDMTTAADVEWDEPVNTLSEWVVVTKDVGSEDDFEVGSKGIDRKEVIQNVLELGQEEEEGKEPPYEVDNSGPKENDDNLVEENVLTAVNPTKLTDSLAVTNAAADIKFPEPSSKGIALDQDIGSEDIFQLGFMENDRKEDIKDVVDSSLERVEETELPMEVNDSGPKEIHENAVEEYAFIDPKLTELENYSTVRTTTDSELGEPVDAISSKGVVLVRDVGSVDSLELDSKKNEGKEVIQDVISSRGIVFPQDIGSEDVHELGPKENDGKEVNEDALNSEQPRMEVLDSDPVLKGPKKRRVAKKKTNGSSKNETDSQGSKKRRAAKKRTNVGSQSETDSQGPKENYDDQVEENDGKEDIEDVLDSSTKKVEVREPPMEINEPGPKENREKAVEEDALINPTPIELEDDSAMRTTADVELAEPVDDISSKGVVLARDVGSEDISELDSKKNEEKEVIQDAISSRGIVLPQDIGSEDVLELGPKKNDGKEVNEDALNSEQPPKEVLDSDPVLKGPKKRRAAKKKTNVSSQKETDSQGSRKRRAAKKKTNVSSQSETDSQGPKENYDNRDEENVLDTNSTELGFKENDGKEDIDPTPIELEDDSAVRTTADVELAEPVDDISKGVLVLDVGSEDILELDSKKNEGKEVIQDVISSRGIVLPQDIGSEDVLEWGPKENDGKEVNEDALISEQPPLEVLGLKKRRAAKKKANVNSKNETDSQVPLGPRKRRAAKMKTNVRSQNETDSQGPTENYDNQVEETVFIESNSIELENGLALRNVTAEVESRKPVDEASSKGVALLQDIGNDGKEVAEDVCDSSQEKVEGKEHPVEVNDLGPVEEDVLIDPTPFKPEDVWAARTADDDRLAEPVDAVSVRGGILVRDVGSEDILEFGSKKNEVKGVIEDVSDSSSEEDDETHAEGLGPGSVLKVVFSKYCFTILCIVVLLVASKQQLVPLLSTCSTGSSWSRLFSPIGAYLCGENALTEYHSMDIDEAWVLKIADDIAALAEPAHSLPSKGFFDEVGSDNDLDIDLKKNIGRNLLEDNELAEEHLDSGPTKKSREPAAEVLYSVPKENDGNLVVEDPLTGELELASDSKETEGNELASFVRGDSSDSPSVVDLWEDDSASSKEVVQNVLELGSRRIDEIELLKGKELAEELLDSGPMVKAREPTADVFHSDPKENDGKPVLEDPLTAELELASDTKESEGKEFASIVGSDCSDSTSKEAVQNVLESGSKRTEKMELLEASEPGKRVLDWGPTENVDKPEVDDVLTRELELESDKDVTEGKEMDSVLGSYPLDSAAGVVTPDHMEDDTVILSREVVQNVYELGSISSDGEDILERNKQSEKVVNESAVEDLWTKDLEMESESKETGGKLLASKEVGPKENDGKQVVEDLQADELEMTSDSKEIERKELASVVASDDSVFPKTVVQNALLEGKSGRQNVGVDGDDLMALIKEVRKTIKEQLIVVEDMRVNLRKMLGKVNLIRTAVQG